MSSNSETRPFRKRQIIIRRDFVLFNNKLDEAYLCALTDKARQQLIHRPEDQNQLEWNSLNTPYVSANVRLLMSQMTNNKKIFDSFSIVVSSLLFIPSDKGNTSNEMSFQSHVLEYFDRIHSKQRGGHVFVNCWGDLHLIFTCVKEESGSIVYYPKVLVPLTSIYPVMRYEFEHKPTTGSQTSLAFGLWYSTDFKAGDRYYHILGERLYQRGGVFELTLEYWNIFMRNPSLKFIAFYVCVGAKLVVSDSYDDQKDLHNRVLTQQGGIVVIEGDLKVSLPIEAKDSQSRDELGFRSYDWKDFCDKYLIPVNKSANSADPRNVSQFTNGVIFLGATNSQYNSITWHLSVTPQREVVLTPPMGARITAIEDGMRGTNEINARIRYEMLSDSVITNTYTGIQFAAPKTVDGQLDYEMTKTILNLNEKRSFNVLFEKIPALDESEVPREFNISTVSDDKQFDRWFRPFLQTQRSRLCAPPMYPPVIIRDAQNLKNVFYLPSKEMSVKDVDLCYGYDKKKVNITLRDPFTKNFENYGYFKWEYMAFHYKKLETDINDMTKLKTGQYHIESGQDFSFYRIGVDGWLWQKVGDQPIYNESTTYFTKEDQTSQRFGQNSGHQEVGSGKANDGSVGLGQPVELNQQRSQTPVFRSFSH